MEQNDKSTEWNRRIRWYIDKIDVEKSFGKEDVEMFLQDLAGNSYAPAGWDNPQLHYLKSRVNDPLVIKALTEYFNCASDEIYFGNLDNRFKDERLPYKAVFGNVVSHNIKDLGDVVFIEGNVTAGEEIDHINSLRWVGGNMFLLDSPMKSLNNVEIIGKDLSVDGVSDINNLGSVRYIGGSIFAEDSMLQSRSKKNEIADQLDYVGGTIFMKTETHTWKSFKEKYNKQRSDSLRPPALGAEMNAAKKEHDSLENLKPNKRQKKISQEH